MKKIILMIFTFLMILDVGVYAYGINDVMDADMKNNIQESFEHTFVDTDVLDLIERLNSGDFSVEDYNVLEKLKKVVTDNFRNNTGFVFVVFVMVMLSALIDNIHTSFKNEKAAHQVITGVVILSLITITTDVSGFAIHMIDKLILFINSLLPTLMTLVATSGKVGTAGILNPVMVGISSVISLVIKSFVVPLCIMGLAVKLTGIITEKKYLENFGDQLYKLIKWTLGLIFTIYVGIVSIVGVVSPKVDEITLKTTKYAVGSFIPYVGGMVADSVDLILACSEVVKNSVGIAGLIGILSVVVIPCIEIAVKVILINLLGVVISPVAGNPVLKSVNSVSSCFSILLGMVIVVSVMYILSVTVIIFVGGA